MSKIVFRDPLAILKMAKFEIGRTVGDDVFVSCPFHTGDHTPSCAVNTDKLVFRCHGCTRGGRFEELLAMKVVGETTPGACEAVRRMYKEFLDELHEKNPLDPGRVEAFHRALITEGIESLSLLATLAEKKGILKETVERRGLGWNGERYTIPVYDRQGNIVNIRYRSLRKGIENKTINHKGRGEHRLYLVDNLDVNAESVDKWVWVTEGELKALLLDQWGEKAVCGTGGAGTWDPEWNVWFKDRKVAVLYDIDEPGRSGALTVARNLSKYAAEVRIVDLPLDPLKYPTGDLTEWVLLEGGTRAALIGLLEQTKPFEFDFTKKQSPIELPLSVLGSLADLDDPAHHDRHIQVEAIVAAEEPELYRVPIAWTVACHEDQKCCSICPIKQSSIHEYAPQPFVRIELLRMLDSTEEGEQIELKRWSEIPRACQAHRILVKERANMRAIELIPDIDSNTSGDRDATIQAFHVSKGTEDRRELHGSLHTVKGFPTTDPKGNRLVMLLHDIQASKGSLEKFDVNDFKDGLRVFQPEAWTKESLETRLASIYRDLSANVTHIYGRRDLHFVTDLAYHSLLEIPFNHRTMRGWIEVAILGDTGQGKSQCVEALRRYYGLGDVAVGASCTSAGLLGSVQESARKKRWVYRWGKIPLNDRRLVILEEVSGMPLEIIQKLRDARSSGRHEDTKAKLTRVRTRTRLIWMGNPRSNKTMNEMQHGITALRELIGDDPDVRRIDLAYFVGRGEVNVDDIRNGTSTIDPVYEASLGRALVMWAWSRDPEQIRFDPDAAKACRTLGRTLSDRYSGRIPLILDTEVDEKLARLSASLAARTFSHSDNDEETVLVRVCHVEFIAEFLERLYSSKICGYNAFSERVRLEDSVADSGKVQEQFADLTTAESTAQFLLEVDSFSTRDFAAVSSMEYPKAEQFIGMLLRARAVRPNPAAPNSYTKTPGFVELLKRMVSTLSDTTAEEKYKDQIF